MVVKLLVLKRIAFMDKTNELGVALLNSSSKPPPILYKYLSDTQVKNVLENGNVRFTPLSNTNDSFEIRANFKQMAGPKFSQMLINTAQDIYKEDFYNKIIEDAFNIVQKQLGMKLLNRDQLSKEFEKRTGTKLEDHAKQEVFKIIKTKAIPFFNSKSSTKKFLNHIGKQLCFSLSEQANINPMWAHYANSHKGFVIAFDTTSTWFRKRSDGKKRHLLKVNYFDGQIEEPLADIYKTIASKTTAWAYEQEWRTHVSEDGIDSIIETSEEPIHLINFPPDAIQRIILGEKIKPDIENQIKEIALAKYPHAGIYRIQSDSLLTTMNEIKV